MLWFNNFFSLNLALNLAQNDGIYHSMLRNPLGEVDLLRVILYNGKESGLSLKKFRKGNKEKIPTHGCMMGCTDLADIMSRTIGFTCSAGERSKSGREGVGYDL